MSQPLRAMSVRALNLYYARDSGVRAEVLATRLRASDVRARIGIPRGRIFQLASGGDAPDVMWDCAFADARAHDIDMQARAASADFEACRATMRTLTRRFERVLYEEHADGLAPAEVGKGAHLTQIWVSDACGAPDIGSLLRSGSVDRLLERMDGNTRLPDWIIELSSTETGRGAAAMRTWLAHQPTMRSVTLRWERVS